MIAILETIVTVIFTIVFAMLAIVPVALLTLSEVAKKKRRRQITWRVVEEPKLLEMKE